MNARMRESCIFVRIYIYLILLRISYVLGHLAQFLSSTEPLKASTVSSCKV